MIFGQNPPDRIGKMVFQNFCQAGFIIGSFSWELNWNKHFFLKSVFCIFLRNAYRYKFPNWTVRNFRTATCGSAEWPAEIAWYAAEMHRSCGISAPLTAEFPHHILRNPHGMMRTRARTISGGKCARYAEEIPHGPIRKFGNLNLYDLTILYVDCTAPYLTLRSRTMSIEIIYTIPLLVNNLVETTLI